MVSGTAYMAVVLCAIYLVDRIEVPEVDFLEQIASDAKALAIFLGLLLIAMAIAVRPAIGQDVPESAADTAEAHVGITEQPKNSNEGPYIEECLSHVGLGPGYPYCAACASMWMDDIGADGPFGEEGKFKGEPIRSALSAHFMQARVFVPAHKVKQWLVQIPPGSIAIWLKGNSGHGHTGVVWGNSPGGGESWGGQCGYTIEANTTPSTDAPPEDQREGGGIWGPKRRCINLNAYFRLVGFAVPLT
jgi:hypothetical protein